MQFLVFLSGLDIDVYRISESKARASVLRLIVLRMEPESNLEVGFGVSAIRMQVEGVRDDTRSSPEKPTPILIKDVGVPTNFMHWPGRCRSERVSSFGDPGAIDHMVEDEPSADSFPNLVGIVIVHLANLYGLHIAVLGQPGWGGLDVAPPIGRASQDREVWKPDNQVWFSGGPTDSIVEF